MPSRSPVRPPVSTTTNSRAPLRYTPYWRSRVSPGRSCTSASRVRVSTLKSVDLPTLGRPTSATTGSIGPTLTRACGRGLSRQRERQKTLLADAVRADYSIDVFDIDGIADNQRRGL